MIGAGPRLLAIELLHLPDEPAGVAQLLHPARLAAELLHLAGSHPGSRLSARGHILTTLHAAK